MGNQCTDGNMKKNQQCRVKVKGTRDKERRRRKRTRY